MLETSSAATAAPCERDEITQALRDSTDAWVREKTDHKALRASRRRLPGLTAERLREFGRMGWLGILIPESLGGAGLGFREMAAVAEALGRGLLADPLVEGGVLAARAVVHGDRADAQAQLLAAFSQGERSLHLAWQEDADAFGVNDARCVAQARGDGFQIDGTKRFIDAAPEGDFLVTAQVEGRLALLCVSADAAGVSLSHAWRADGGASTTLALQDVRVVADALVASPGHAGPAVQRAIDEACIMASAELLGIMRTALAMTLDYLRTRVQFGRPIGSFQALQHKAVDLYALQELSVSVLEEAIAVADAPHDERALARTASRLKARCSDAALRIAREAIQLHGAIGYTDEHDIGLYLKRAMVLSAWLGNAAQQRARYAAMEGEAGA